MIIAALTTSLLAVCLHFYLTLQHFQLKLGLTSGQSFCNINQTFNCDTVSVSPYAVLFGIPIATWGAVTNLALVVMLAVALINLTSNSLRVLRLSFWLSLFIALTSIVMGTISSVLLKTYCLNCMAAYALSFATLFLIWKSLEESPLRDLFSDLKSMVGEQKWIGAMFVLVPALSFLTTAIIGDSYGLPKIKAALQESQMNWRSAPVVPLDLSKGLSFQRGQSDPIMTIVEFADFRCPHCKMASPTLETFAEGRTDVRLIFKSFPLDGVCNPDINRKGDGSSCQLAYAVFCSEKISQKGWKAHHWIFDHQESFFSVSSPNDLLKEFATENSIPFEQLQSCMNSGEVADLVSGQAKEGGNAKIGGTPTIFVNGRLLDRGQFMPVLEAVYEELKGSGR